jgi:RNA polymerase sigma-70 factor, ECF subfamily
MGQPLPWVRPRVEKATPSAQNAPEYLRLVDAPAVDWRDRAHFFAVSARMMRRILVDAARTRLAAKRGGGFGRVNHSAAVN